jgi:hypothetical protein
MCQQLEPRALMAAAYSLADYFPTTIGATWHYQAQINSVSATKDTVAAATVNDMGFATTRFDSHITRPDDPEDDQDFYVLDNAGLHYVDSDSITTGDDLMQSYTGGLLLCPATFQIGQTFQHSAPINGNSDQTGPFTGTETGHTTIAGFENVTTPAGTFLALKIVLQDTFTINVTGPIATGTITDTRWLVRTLGVVREDETTATNFLDGSHEVDTNNIQLTSSSLLTGRIGFGLTGKQLTIGQGDTTPTTADGSNYGGIDVDGAGKTRVFVIHNNSTNALTVGAVTITGAGASDFSLIHIPSSSLAPGETSYIAVRFDPSGSGFRYATISIGSSDPTADPFTFTIRGTGLLYGRVSIHRADKAINITPGGTATTPDDGTSFGRTTAAGSAFINQTFVLTNTGLGTLYFLGTPRVQITGPAAGDFTVVNAVGASLAPGQSLTFTVRFDPTALDRRDATIEIITSELLHPDFTFAISGRGK